MLAAPKDAVQKVGLAGASVASMLALSEAAGVVMSEACMWLYGMAPALHQDFCRISKNCLAAPWGHPQLTPITVRLTHTHTTAHCTCAMHCWGLAAPQRLQQESEARAAAEASERRALEAAAHQARLLEEVLASQAAAKAAATAKKEAAAVSAALKAQQPLLALADGQTKPVSRTGLTGGQRLTEDPAEAATAAAAAAAAGDAAYAVSRLPKQQQGGSQTPDVGVPGQQRSTCHKAFDQVLTTGSKLLGQAAVSTKRLQAAALLEESRQTQAALASAPQQLSAVGLAFRGLVVGAPGVAATGTPGEQLVTGVSATHRLFADPACLQLPSGAAAAAGGAPTSSSCSSTVSSLLGVCGTVVLLCSPGLLCGVTRVSQLLVEAVEGGCPLLLVCPPQLQLAEMTGGASPGAGAGAAAAVEGATARDMEVGCAGCWLGANVWL